tara:strand:+ start:42 stop:377 length:336 start_codon:yes stop_codon:yes gene_type:complete
MSNIIERFSKHLTSVEYPDKNASWHIAGILENKNAFHRFDVRDMHKMPDGNLGKKGNTKTKADKIVFETPKQWFIVDVEELHKYIKTKSLKIIQVERLLSDLEWNIIIAKK